ncbi:sensor histidine kinase [Massilia rhizosphaerae]|uniref:sensor histidine kinase n=1 Tax=Massilia rhizosphaerae TaxID=2784389 RepID=UPI001E51B64A|nr:sensor histidine kinase [Massilia rhizosphaerae]
MKSLRRLLPRALGAWLALAFVLLSIILTLALTSVIERKSTEQVETSIGHGLAELAMQTSDKLERGMFERYREVGLLARRRVLGEDQPHARRRATLDAIRNTLGYYSWIGLADLDGKVQVAAQGLLEGADVSRRPWFRNALRGIHADDVHEAMLLARHLPRQTEPWRFVDVAFPYIDDEGVTRGVLGAHLSWQWARDVERSVMAGIAARRQAEALIVDTDGNVLLGPADVVGKRLTLQSLQAAHAQIHGGYVVETWPDGRSYLVGYQLGHGYGDYPGLGWTVLVRQNVDDAFAPVRRLREYGLASGVLLALLFSLAGVALARRITRPLGDLADAAQRIRAGETARIEVGRGGYAEVRALGMTLNTLVANLVRRRRDLEALNATLEERVALRTRELEQALASVRTNEQRIATIIATAQDAFVGIDMRGRICDWNSAAETMLGWPRGQAVGRHVADLVIPERFRARTRELLARFLETGELEILGRRVERVLLACDGREIPVEMTVGLAGTGDGLFFSVFVHDISARKEVERMKDEFVATVSHELRTPLTAISASLALLADGMAGELPPDAQGLVDVANASSGRLVRLVGDVLDIQKMDAGGMAFERAVQPLLPLAQDAVAAMQAFAARAGVELSCVAAPGAEGMRVDVDRDRLAQVLTNLLSNAIKFSGPGARVRTQVEARGDAVRLAVADEGAGIPEAFRERVFQRFAQADGADSRRQGGTGLGLSICKTIVEELGGNIWFDSAEGIGTTFYVELPLAA